MGIGNEEQPKSLQEELEALITPHGDRKHNQQVNFCVELQNSLPLMGIGNLMRGMVEYETTQDSLPLMGIGNCRKHRSRGVQQNNPHLPLMGIGNSPLRLRLPRSKVISLPLMGIGNLRPCCR